MSFRFFAVLSIMTLTLMTATSPAFAQPNRPVSQAELDAHAANSTAHHGRPDGPCFNSSTDRFIDCGNGTVTDTVTGLIWLKALECLGDGGASSARTGWLGAVQAATSLAHGSCGLTDGSARGDWRLPTFDEWVMTVNPQCSPALENDAGLAQCASVGPSVFAGTVLFDPNEDITFWSSTPLTLSEFPSGQQAGDEIWTMDMSNGMPAPEGFGGPQRVWPVRRGN
ncbi:MAG: DUF1566 domain-containing protein [Hyphomonadaceae bacterium]